MLHTQRHLTGGDLKNSRKFKTKQPELECYPALLLSNEEFANIIPGRSGTHSRF
jgi:hypothetical protein